MPAQARIQLKHGGYVGTAKGIWTRCYRPGLTITRRHMERQVQIGQICKWLLITEEVLQT